MELSVSVILPHQVFSGDAAVSVRAAQVWKCNTFYTAQWLHLVIFRDATPSSPYVDCHKVTVWTLMHEHTPNACSLGKTNNLHFSGKTEIKERVANDHHERAENVPVITTEELRLE